MDIVWWSAGVLVVIFYTIWIAETFTKKNPAEKGSQENTHR